jgi:hypothetical protein
VGLTSGLLGKPTKRQPGVLALCWLVRGNNGPDKGRGDVAWALKAKSPAANAVM